MTIDELIRESNPVETERLPRFDSPLGITIAASVTATESITQLDRVKGRRPMLRFGVLAATGSGIVALILGLAGPGTENAFAAWSSTPTTAPAGQVAAAESSCLQAVVGIATSRASAPRAPIADIVTNSSAWSVVVTDTRGPFTLVGYSATTSAATDRASCLVGNGIGPEVSFGWNPASDPTPAPAAGSINGPTTSWNAQDNYTVAIGVVGTGVTGLSVNLSDGTAVTTTVSNGYYAAWWPGNPSPQSWEVTTPSGTSQVALPGEQPIPGATPANGNSAATGNS